MNNAGTRYIIARKTQGLENPIIASIGMIMTAITNWLIAPALNPSKTLEPPSIRASIPVIVLVISSVDTKLMLRTAFTYIAIVEMTSAI